MSLQNADSYISLLLRNQMELALQPLCTHNTLSIEKMSIFKLLCDPLGVNGCVLLVSVDQDSTLSLAMASKALVLMSVSLARFLLLLCDGNWWHYLASDSDHKTWDLSLLLIYATSHLLEPCSLPNVSSKSPLHCWTRWLNLPLSTPSTVAPFYKHSSLFFYMSFS